MSWQRCSSDFWHVSKQGGPSHNVLHADWEYAAQIVLGSTIPLLPQYNPNIAPMGTPSFHVMFHVLFHLVLGGYDPRSLFMVSPILRQDESSSHLRIFASLLHESCADPLPCRLLRQVLRPEQLKYYKFIPVINSSASQASKNALSRTPRPPQHESKQTRRTLFLVM